MPKLGGWGRIVVTLVVIISGGMVWSGCTAQTLSPYSEFQAMTVAQMQTLQGKITFVGDRRSSLKTLAIRANGQAPSLGVFSPFYRSQFLPGGYNEDYQPFLSFSATAQQLKDMIDSVAAVTEVTDGGVDIDGYLSFALANVIDGDPKVFESVVNPTTGRLLFGRLLGAFSANDSAKTVLTARACVLGMLPGGPPTDVTSQVSLQSRGFRKDRGTGQYVGRVRITNTSQQSIAEPLIFVFAPPANVMFIGAAGTTCAISPRGASYVPLAVGETFTPGEHVDVLMRFENPDGDPIRLSGQRVFAGVGFK